MTIKKAAEIFKIDEKIIRKSVNDGMLPKRKVGRTIEIPGGIVGYATRTISKCYNQGNAQGDSSVGGVAGEADIFFGEAEISETYYLKNESTNNEINGIGNASDNESGCAFVDTPKED